MLNFVEKNNSLSYNHSIKYINDIDINKRRRYHGRKERRKERNNKETRS